MNMSAASAHLHNPNETAPSHHKLVPDMLEEDLAYLSTNLHSFSMYSRLARSWPAMRRPAASTETSPWPGTSSAVTQGWTTKVALPACPAQPGIREVGDGEGSGVSHRRLITPLAQNAASPGPCLLPRIFA